MMLTMTCKGGHLAISFVDEQIVRVRFSKQASFEETTGTVRYGIYHVAEGYTPVHSQKDGVDIFESPKMVLRVDAAQNALALECRKTGRVWRTAPAQQADGLGLWGGEKGFRVDLEAADEDKFYGLGDIDREKLERRGVLADIYVRNVRSYAPAPYLMTSRGFAVFSNTTYQQFIDVCHSNQDRISILSREGQADLFFFVGADYAGLIASMQTVTGRPSLLPKYAYGLTYVCNQQASARDMAEDMMHFRAEDMPCDVIGLEPGWMETYYDTTVNKKVDPTRFYVPSWMDNAKASHETWFGPIDRLGFKLSLWLCCDYDLSWEAERRAVIPKTLPEAPQAFEPTEDDVEQDKHFGHLPMRMDKVTEPDQGWFEHLKHFVDMGAKAFKLDGAWQVNEHIDRLYGNGMDDKEMHNLYTLLLNQQMAKGFEEHTGKRAMVYSSGGFAGIQQFSATWAGDTGGGFKTLVSMLNHAMSGHVNTSCDMSVYAPEGVHYGFLQAWSQVCNWAYWRQPWLLDKPMKETFRFYDKLRYSIIPYIYTTAHEAYETGMPVMRPLALVYPDDQKAADVQNAYFFGPNLLVTAFTDDLYLPKGEWVDYFTGELRQGPFDGKYQVPKGRGGGLFVRAGSILPKWKDRDFVEEGGSAELILELFPKGSSEYELYEDDGESLAYREGTCARTTITCRKEGNVVHVDVGQRRGAYAGMPKVRTNHVRVFGQKAASVSVNGVPAEHKQDGAFTCFEAPEGAVCMVEYA